MYVLFCNILPQKIHTTQKDSNRHMRNKKTYNCPVEATIDLSGGKYKAIILWHLIDKTLRFNEIQKLLSKLPLKC
jgi:DNA-binding HxlR family transcriptional regulator